MQAPQTDSINEYDFSALEEIQPKSFNLSESLKEMLFYVLPIFSFGFFLLILFGAILPTIQNITDTNAAVDSLKQQDQALKQRITTINNLSNNNAKTEEILQKINAIIPTGRTEVVKFGERIDASIAAHSLVSNKRTIGETVLVNSSDQNTATQAQTSDTSASVLPLSDIPTQFDIQGTYENIRSFFIDLYKGQDFFVVDNMDLTSTSTGDDWNGKVSLVKYQFSPSANFDPVKAFLGIDESSPLNQQVLDFLEQKFINNVFEVTPTPTVTPTP